MIRCITRKTTMPEGLPVMLNVRLNAEYEKKLNHILARTRMDKSDLIRKMIDDQFEALQCGKTWVERRGGHPAYFTDATAEGTAQTNLSQTKAAREHIERLLNEKKSRRRVNRKGE